MIGAVRSYQGCVLVCLALMACNREGADCFTPLGEPETRTVQLSEDINAIEIRDYIDVEWSPVPDSEGARAIWSGGAGTLDGLDATVTDGTLVIQDLNSCRWVRSMEAVPTVRLAGWACREVLLEGQGSFTMVDTLVGGDLDVEGNEMAGPVKLRFAGDTLKVRMPNGIGHVHIAGRALRLRSFRSGFGDLDARALYAESAMVNHAGVGEVHLRASQYLYLAMGGAGNAYLHNTPSDQVIQYLDGATGSVLTWP